MRTRPTRRDVLRGTAAVGLGSTLWAPGAFARTLAPLRPDRRTKRVVLIAMSGGVRSRETFGAPTNVPNLAALADEGVLFTALRTSNLGHFGASMSIVTGIAEPRGIRENTRPTVPTVFEYLRKGLGLSAGDVWIATSGGAQQANYSYSVHPEYGRDYGATLMDGDGIFNREFKELLSEFGLPDPMDDGERAALARLRAGLGGGDPADAAALARVEGYILQELTRGTSDLTGANAGDAKALRLARNLLTIFKPRVVGVVLQNADVAHGSFNGYVEVIRRNDEAIGELVAAIRADEELADSTAIFVLPEFGRDRDLNARRGLDHGDGSRDLNFVHGVAWGPDFRRGKVVDDERRTIDVAPTICDLFGAEAPLAKGDVLRGVYA